MAILLNKIKFDRLYSMYKNQYNHKKIKTSLIKIKVNI